MNENPSSPPRSRVWQLIVGMLAANAIGGALLFGVVWFVGAYKNHDASALTHHKAVAALVIWAAGLLGPVIEAGVECPRRGERDARRYEGLASAMSDVGR